MSDKYKESINLLHYFLQMGIFDNYDSISKGIIQQTYDLAEEQSNNPVDVPHLFSILVNKSNNKISQLLTQGGVDIQIIKEITKTSLASALSIKDQFSISLELNNILVEANNVAKHMGSSKTDIYSIFLSLLKSDNSIAKQLNKQGITFEKIQSIVSQMSKSKVKDKSDLDNFSIGEELNKYSEDITQLAKNGKLKEVIGRDKDLKKIIEVLSRKEKNNVIVLGESGVGKTAVVELLAQKIALGEVPEFLKDKKILKINLGSLLGGTKFRGEFEEKIGGIIKTVKESEGKIILFIDEFHNVAGAGKSEGSMDLAEMLKPELSSGDIQVIGATTTSEYRQNIEKDSGLTRRFETITVQEPNVQDTITILRGIEGSFEKHHGVTIYDTALVAAVELSDKYIKDRKLPDKAINILDQASARVKMSMTELPEIISEMKTKIGQLKQNSDSIEQETLITKDEFVKKEYSETKLKLEEQIMSLQSDYDSKKSDWEKMKHLFSENKNLLLQITEFEDKDKDLESKSDLESVSKVKYEDIVQIQKSIETNKEEITKLQNQSGIIMKDVVEREDIAQVIAEKTGIPITKMIDEESKKLANLESFLSTKVIGQSEAISEISNAIRRARVGLKDPKKPMGSFLFLGPTGVGKTELAKALAEFLFFDKKAMIRFNMSEYKEEYSTSKLIGSPPGYIGYEKGGELTEAVRRKPYSLILLDEVEKAHQGVFDLFLQVLDDGMLNDSLGNTVDFKNTVIIMTSNIGSHEIMEKLKGSEGEVGDLYPVEINEDKKTNEPQGQKSKRNRRQKKNNNPETKQGEQINSITEELKEDLQPVLMDFFRPEFLNRLDNNIIFNPISPEMLKNILEIKIKEQSDLIYSTNKISLDFSNQAKNYLAKKGRDPANGARPINRALQRYILDPLSLEIVSGNLTQGDNVSVEIEDNKLIFKKL